MKKICFAALMLVANFAMAAGIPGLSKTSHFTDLSHLLTPQQATAMEQNVAAIEKKGDMQFIVVVVPILPPGMSLENFTTLVSNNYPLAYDKDKLVYIATIRQHQHRLIATSGVKSPLIFTSQACEDILSQIRPFYSKSDYNGGLDVLMSKVSAALPAAAAEQTAPHSFLFIIALAAGAAILLALGGMFFRSKRKKEAYS